MTQTSGTLRSGTESTGLVRTPQMYNLEISEAAAPLLAAVIEFMRDEIEPVTDEYHRLGEGRADRWSYGEGQLELLDGLKAKAKEQGLWNFFLPDAETGEGLSNLDYAYIAFELGKNPIASECLNCSAPDTGNMEVLERVGTPEQKARWLTPLLAGEIRSCFGMTEPAVASSDAKNIATQAVRDGDEWVINGEKYWISGAGDPRCKVMITMVQQILKHQHESSNHKSWFRWTHLVSRSSVRCMCSVRTMHPTAICRFGSIMFEYRQATCCSARVEVSRSPNSASGRGESITACGQSARANGRCR